MKIQTLAAVLAASLALGSVNAMGKPRDVEALAENHADAIAFAARRGAEIFRHDQAAWHVTDAFLDSVGDPNAIGAMGWVVDEQGNDLRVTFYRQMRDGSLQGVWSALWDGGAVRDGHLLEGEEALLSADQSARIAALQTATADGPKPCGGANFNPVVLAPEEEGGAHTVYFLTAQTQAGVIPMGGHYRYEVKDGAIADKRAFAKTCLSMGGPQTGGENLMLMSVTHMLDPVPTEIHAFSTLSVRTPILVLTTSNKQAWMVMPEGDKVSIERVEM